MSKKNKNNNDKSSSGSQNKLPNNDACDKSSGNSYQDKNSNYNSHD